MSNFTFLTNAFEFFLLFVPRNYHTKNQDSRAENVDRVISPKIAPLWWHQKLSPDGPFQRCPCPDPISASVVIFFPAVLLFFMFLRLASSPKKKTTINIFLYMWSHQAKPTTWMYAIYCKCAFCTIIPPCTLSQ